MLRYRDGKKAPPGKIAPLQWGRSGVWKRSEYSENENAAPHLYFCAVLLPLSYYALLCSVGRNQAAHSLPLFLKNGQAPTDRRAVLRNCAWTYYFSFATGH